MKEDSRANRIQKFWTQTWVYPEGSMRDKFDHLLILACKEMKIYYVKYSIKNYRNLCEKYS
jgi:hypothetical protein